MKIDGLPIFHSYVSYVRKKLPEGINCDCQFSFAIILLNSHFVIIYHDLSFNGFPMGIVGTAFGFVDK